MIFMNKQKEIEYSPLAVTRLRDGLGLSKAQFGEKLGLSRQYIHFLEAGKIRLHADLLAKMKNVFKCSMDIFFVEKITATQKQGDV